MSRRRKNLVMEKYKVYLGSVAERSYQESVDFCKGYAKELNSNDVDSEEIGIIDSGVGDPFACMMILSWMYEGQASVDLVVHGDVQAFKQHAYVAAKLWMLGRKNAYSELPPISWTPTMGV